MPREPILSESTPLLLIKNFTNWSSRFAFWFRHFTVLVTLRFRCSIARVRRGGCIIGSLVIQLLMHVYSEQI